jgi:microcystin-dependent protein
MNSPYIGQVFMFAWDFAAKNYALAQGQLMAINQNQALFSVLGTTYGGNGQTNFALPDLRGRTFIGWGQGPGLSSNNLGEQIGTEKVTLLQNNLPSHSHTANVNNTAATVGVAASNTVLSQGPIVAASQVTTYSGAGANASLNPGALANTGSNQSLSILQPYLAINYSVCLFGLFPSRN